jgi:prepilin-type N-terminal cleavage/methylation domain-containing protein
MIMRRPRGFSLAEMLTVCAVLGVAAAVALPSSQPVVEVRVSTAAGEVARALRFAREEALRGGALVMVVCDTTQNTLSVYQPDASGNVAAAINDPLTHMSYVAAIGAAPAGAGVALRSCSFQFADNTQAAAVAFDANGNPVRGAAVVTGPAPPKGTAPTTDPATALNGGTVQLGLGNLARTVAVDVNGRVTIS